MNIKINFDNNCPDLKGLVNMFVEAGYTPWNIKSKSHSLNPEEYRKWNNIDDILWVHKDAKKPF